jgi:hypothetical protein
MDQPPKALLVMQDVKHIEDRLNGTNVAHGPKSGFIGTDDLNEGSRVVIPNL